MNQAKNLHGLIKKYQIFHCVECGKCTGACPLTHVDQDFSPRLFAKYVIEEGLDSVYVQEKVWACLTCGLCQERCLLGISFADFVREIRAIYFEGDQKGLLTHGGALQMLMRMQSAPRLKQNRLDWRRPDLRTADTGEIMYFVGCLTYFDAYFSDWNLDLQKIAVHTVRILNRLGIEPVVLSDERCCGHDLLYTGDREAFDALRMHNIESFRKAGIKTIVTACAECSHILKTHYPIGGEAFPFQVLHLSEFLRKTGLPDTQPMDMVMTYQDPCRLGRCQKVFHEPREILRGVVDLREMRHAGPGAWCCGNSGWLGCNRYSKQMQMERLQEAKDTRSSVIVTACPKCQIHLSCAMRDVNLLHDVRMRIMDFASVISESMGQDGAP